MKLFIKILLLCVLIAVVYSPAVRGTFLWDDTKFISQNPLLEDPQGLKWFWFSTEAPDYFPLVSTNLWVQRRLWGLNPVGYHCINIIFHMISALLLWRILSLLKIPGAWAASLIFAVHPIQVDSVAWMTQIKNTQSGLFYFLTLLWFIQFQKRGLRRYYWGSLLAFVCALLSKTSVVMLPVVLWLYVWWQQRKVSYRDFRILLPFFLLSALMGSITVYFDYLHNVYDSYVWGASFLQRLAVAGKAVWFYVAKIFVPVNLMFVYPRWALDPLKLSAFVPLMAGVAFFIGVITVFKNTHRGLVFAVGYFLIMIFPVLGFINTYFMRYSFVANQWAYLASPGLIVLSVVGFNALWVKRPDLKNKLCLIAGGLLVSILSFLAWQEAHEFKNMQTLWKTTLKKNPQCYLCHSYLGSVWLEQGEPQKAIYHFKKAVDIRPRESSDYNNIGLAYIQSGDIDYAIRFFHRAANANPDFEGAYYNLSEAYHMKKKYRISIGYFILANRVHFISQKKRKKPVMAEGSYRYWGEVRQIRRFLRANPSAWQGYFYLGLTYAQLGLHEEEIKSYHRALDVGGDNPKITFYLSLAYGSIGDVSQEMRYLQKTIALDPRHGASHNNLAVLYYYFGNIPEALKQCDQALESGFVIDSEFLDVLQKEAY